MHPWPRRLCVAFVFVALLGMLSPTRVHACFIYVVGFITGGPELPADARGLVWQETDLKAPATDEFEVARLEGEQWKPVPHAIERLDDDVYLLAARDDLRPGHRYRFKRHWPVNPNRRPAQVELTVAKAEIGVLNGKSRLRMGPQVVGYLEDVFPVVDIAVKQPMRFELPAGASRWADALVYFFSVDGRRFGEARGKNGEPSYGRAGQDSPGQITLTRACYDPAAEAFVSPITERVTVSARAVLPGTGIEFTVEREVVLSCDAPPEHDPSGNGIPPNWRDLSTWQLWQLFL